MSDLNPYEEGLALELAQAQARVGELEAKLAKLTKAADRVHDSYWNSTDGIIVGMFDLGEALREACAALAELTGGRDE